MLPLVLSPRYRVSGVCGFRLTRQVGGQRSTTPFFVVEIAAQRTISCLRGLELEVLNGGRK